MDERIWGKYLNRWGLISIVANITLVLIAYFVPGLMGDSRQGELENTRLELFVISVNYPAFWVFANSPIKYLSGSSFGIGMLFAAMALYWYCEGLLVAIIIRSIQNSRILSDSKR